MQMHFSSAVWSESEYFQDYRYYYVMILENERDECKGMYTLLYIYYITAYNRCPREYTLIVNK